MFDGLDWGADETQRRIDRRRLNKLIERTVYITIFFLLAGFVIWISGTTTMQRDTLNTMNLQQQEMNDLDSRITNMEILYQTEQKNVSASNDEPISLSQSDRELIERTCMAESNSIDGMMAVAQCIHDRSMLWDMTPYEAVTQDSQFAKPVKGEISAEAVQAVWAVFDENMKAFEDNNVTHFYAEDSQEPYWTVNKDYIGTRGGNRFYESKY